MSLPYIELNGVRVELPLMQKERPRCRRWIEKHLKDNNKQLEELWEEMRARPHEWSNGMRKQCRVMMWEYFPTLYKKLKNIKKRGANRADSSGSDVTADIVEPNNPLSLQCDE